MNKVRTRQTAIAISLLLLLFVVSASWTFAQTVGQAAQDEASQDDTAQANQDANWVTALGLTPDQIAKIREIRQQNRLEWQTARQRLNQTQRALDQAIYSGEASEAVIEQRAGDVARAQATEVRLRAMTELRIRRVLTPQQLSTFRAIRQQRFREAQIRRRENAVPQRRPGNRRLENGITPGSTPVPGPRQGRGGFRRIRP